MNYQVAVSYPGKNYLTYSFSEDLFVGQMVEVPLGKRSETGCVISVVDKPEFAGKIKEIKSIHEGWVISDKSLKLYIWMSQYYHYSLGQLIADSEISPMKRPREVKIIQGLATNNITPNASQLSIIIQIKNKLKDFHRFLIHGITGSGKTIIYLELIKTMIENKKSVHLLVPEINLTPQLLDFFKTHVDADIFPYHSELNASEKYKIWQMAKLTEKPILLIGVRSSVFIDFSNLGLIIIDEEHDASFKQEDRCPYNARDVATKKAQLEKIPIIYGSATPSLETLHFFKKHENKNYFFELFKRANESNLPLIKVIDAREKTKENPTWPFSHDTLDLIDEALGKNEQVIVFLNRLGFSQYISCRSCGWSMACPNCSVNLKFFKKRNELVCYHCDFKISLPKECPDCGNLTLIQKGYGTEKLEEVLIQKYPNSKISRFDRDVIKNFKQMTQTLEDFHSGKTDILIGTQMISKGHNFRKVNTVVVMGIDQQLNFPDFRAIERSFQMITQVSGRAGRYESQGRVIIQTINPEHPIFHWIKEDPTVFYQEEDKIRQLTFTPPYSKLAVISFSSRFLDRLTDYLNSFVSPLCHELASKNFTQVRVLGPKPSMVEKKINQYTWQFLFKSQDLNQLHGFLQTLEVNMKLPSSISYKMDIDPYQMT